MQIGLGLSLTQLRRFGSFSPAVLFALAEPGVWYDPSDLTTMFTDTAGTTPATVGSAVALLLDKSGNGINATQATLAARPILGRVPSVGRRNILVGTATLATQTRVVTAAQHTLSFRGTGTVTLTGASTSGPLVGTGADDIVSLTFTPTAGNLTLTVLGTVNDAQLELGAVRTAYQLVGSITFDVTEAGQPDNYYLSFDGVDDSMVTPTITPGVDKVQVFAGVRKLSDTGSFPSLVEFGNSSSGPGAIALFAPEAAGTPSYSFRSIGLITSTATAATGYAAPTTNVLTGRGDIALRSSSIRIDGTQVAITATGTDTGNYSVAALQIGRRGASAAFNGQIFSLIVRFGANLNAGTISSTEKWVSGKTAGVTL
jgi:hypothetical protein